MKINHNYFALNTTAKNLIYFVRQGHIWAHIKDRIKWHIYPRFYIVPDFPTHLEVEVSSMCQLRCPMCKSTHMREVGISFSQHMDLVLYYKIIKEAVREKVYSIKFSWRGEPLLHPNIAHMVWYAKRSGIKDVAFLTNGHALNTKMAGALVNAGLDWISISFDGFKEDYDKIRYPAKFEDTFAKVQFLRKYRDSKEIKKPQIRVQSIWSVIRGRETEFLKLWEGVADKVYFIPDQVRTLDEEDYKHDLSYICPNPWQRICIAANGNVVQCITDYTESVVLGNVNEQSIKEIWHGEKMNEFRRLMRSGRRLENKPCRLCGTGNEMVEEDINVEGRKMHVARYK